MRVGNPDRSPVGINRRDTAQTPTALLEITGDDFPVLHAGDSAAFALHTATTK